MTNETAIPPDRNGCCPGCSGRRVQTVPGRGLSFEDPTRSNVFRQNDYHILRCEDCGLVFKDSILTAEQFARYYDDFEFSEWEASEIYPSERPVLRLLRSLPSDSKVLDFGCSAGRLLAQLAGSYRRYGFEINREAAAKAAERGISMIEKWDDLAAHASTVDALVMADVFEHLEHPTETLESLVRLVKPGGVLVIVTGNADCRACQVDLANFWYFRRIQHVAMLTRQYCEFIARKFELRISDWCEVSHYELTLRQKAGQHLRQFVYSCQYRNPASVLSRLFRLVPVLRRCATWNIPPPFTASRDHVVATFRKPANGRPRMLSGLRADKL